MKKNFWFLIFSIITLNSISATAGVWYVRPEGGKYNLENGTSFENAWDGLSNIKWGDGGIEAGDTLYICGSHGSQTLEIGADGGLGKEITIRGDFATKPGAIGHQSIEDAVSINGRKYLIFIGLTIRDSRSGISGTNGCQNIIIDNCTFRGHQRRGLAFSSKNPLQYVQNIWIRNCTFTNIGGWGDTKAKSLGFIGYTRNTLTEDCSFEGNGVTRGVDGILFENNTGDGSNHVVRRCRFSGHDENSIDLKHVVESSAGEGRTLIYENDFSGSNGREIVIHHGTQGIDIFRNRFHDGRHGIGVVLHKGADNSSGDLRIFYNLFYDLSMTVLQDGYAEGIGQNSFINNTCYNIGYDNNYLYSITINTNNWVIKNNIFYHLSQGRSQAICIRFLENVDMRTVQLDNNCYVINKDDFTYRLPDDTYKTVSELEPSGILANPKFTKLSIRDFSLQHSSPCIDTGVHINGLHPTTDIQGLRAGIGKGIDIGAIETFTMAPQPPANIRVGTGG
jgi:hypothetical protein